MVIDGQARVLFSREDITHGLLDQPCWGIAGYTPDTARALLTNIMLHAIELTAESEIRRGGTQRTQRGREEE